MADGNSRFTSQSSQGQTTQERLSTNTVGLVAFSDYRKRRADVLEQQEREAREAALKGASSSAPGSGNNTTGNNTPEPAGSDSSASKQPLKKKLKSKKKQGKSLLSFDDEDEDGEDLGPAKVKPTEKKKQKEDGADKDGDGQEAKKSKFAANAAVTVVPKAMTKAALLKEAAERETLRKEFLIQREAVKAADIAIPFVFYDGSNIPGGIVRVKKGDFVWLFLDKSRKVGAERAGSSARRAWARVGVDDLMMVRGTIIIPHVSLWHISMISMMGVPVANPSASIMTSTTSSSTSASVPTASASSITPPKLPQSLNLQLPTLRLSPSRLPSQRPRRRRPCPTSTASKAPRTIRTTQRWSTGGGIRGISTSTLPALGMSLMRRGTLRGRSVEMLAATPSSSRGDADACCLQFDCICCVVVLLLGCLSS